MSEIDSLKEFFSNKFFSEDGDPIESSLLPGMTQKELDALEKDIGFSLPMATRELLEFSRGIQEAHLLEEIDFSGHKLKHFYITDPKKEYRVIGGDGAGNEWLYDFDSSSSDLGPIYYYMHEGPIVVFQARDIHHFLAEWMHGIKNYGEGALYDVYEFRIRGMKSLNENLINVLEARRSSDPVIREFAAEIAEDMFI